MLTKSVRNRHSPQQVIDKLREADMMLAAGKTFGQVLQAVETSEATFQIGDSMRTTDAHFAPMPRPLRFQLSASVRYLSLPPTVIK